jgi:hypothetical protein
MELKNSEHRSSTLTASELSAELSRPLNKKSMIHKKEAPEMTPRNTPPEIRTAQQVLARIAARILIEKARKTDEK